jgi:hypothetical protein
MLYIHCLFLNFSYHNINSSYLRNINGCFYGLNLWLYYKNTDRWYRIFVTIYTLIPSFIAVVGSQDPREKRKSANYWTLLNNSVLVFLVYVFSLPRYCGDSCFFSFFNFQAASSCRTISCFYPLKGRPREFVKPRSTNPRKARDEGNSFRRK